MSCSPLRHLGRRGPSLELNLHLSHFQFGLSDLVSLLYLATYSIPFTSVQFSSVQFHHVLSSPIYDAQQWPCQDLLCSQHHQQ